MCSNSTEWVDNAVIGYVPLSFSQVVPDQSADDAADNDTNDRANGGKWS